MSEPGSGSDVGSLIAKADNVEGGYVLNGRRRGAPTLTSPISSLWWRAPPIAGVKHEGISMFSVPIGTAGVQINQIDTMGGREVNDVYLTDCFVSEERLVGVAGQGGPNWSPG